MKRTLRGIYDRLLQGSLGDATSLLRRRRQISDLKNRLRDRSTVEDVVDETLRCDAFSHSFQKRSELVALLELVGSERPRVICEIGAGDGATLFALCRVAPADARILSLDIAYNRFRTVAAGWMPKSGQHLTCIAGNSHTSEILARAKRWLGRDAGLDLLFIDGDHSFAGVSEDFSMYAPLVRRGGHIALHDIVPDFRTRHGIETANDVGEVPRFWDVLKGHYDDVSEWVEDRDQDGYGIGLIRWTGWRGP